VDILRSHGTALEFRAAGAGDDFRMSMRPQIPNSARVERWIVAFIVMVLVMTLSPVLAQRDNSQNPEPPVGLTESDLILTVEYPQLEIPENRAFIPLIFKVEAPFYSSSEVTVRATFVGGTATPGEDFSMEIPEQKVPAAFGYGFIAIPLIQDEVNEGSETAVFDLSIVGSTNPPVRMEVTLLDDLNPGQVGFVSPRFSANEGSPRGFVEIRLWRTLNTRNASSVTLKLEGKPAALAILGGETRRTARFEPGDSQIFYRIPLVNNTSAQGTQDITLTVESSDDGATIMPGLGSTVLTVGDDETLPEPEPLIILEGASEASERGVMLSTRVPRGYQVRLEYSDTGVEGPWQPYWTFEGADTDRITFNSYQASIQRMFRILPPEPLELTFPW
jgi:hypothetical protein